MRRSRVGGRKNGSWISVEIEVAEDQRSDAVHGESGKGSHSQSPVLNAVVDQPICLNKLVGIGVGRIIKKIELN